MSSVKEIYNLRNYAYVFAIKATLYPEWFFFFFSFKGKYNTGFAIVLIIKF